MNFLTPDLGWVAIAASATVILFGLGREFYFGKTARSGRARVLNKWVAKIGYGDEEENT
jgi:hypothetical protein